MFCSDCGVAASGRFCWKCGARLHGAALEANRSDNRQSNRSDSHVVAHPIVEESAAENCWRHETSYERLLSLPPIRERIAEAAQRHRGGISGEQFLAIFDAIVPTGISVEKLAAALQPIYGKLGLKTGKSSEWTIPAPAGETMVAVLCALAARGHTLKAVNQSPDGCVLQVLLPSSVWALAGDLVVSIENRSSCSLVTAAAEVPGQIYDWGHCRRTLERLRQEILNELSLNAASEGPVRKAA